MSKSDPTAEYIGYICSLYGDVYDDRLEDCKPPAAGDAIRTEDDVFNGFQQLWLNVVVDL